MVEEASELHADPTYVDSEAEDRLHSHDVLFDYSFYPNDPSVPIYQVQSSLLTEHSILPVVSSQFQHKSLSLDPNIKLINAAFAEQDAIGPNARDNAMQVDEVVKDPEVSSYPLRCCVLTGSNSLH